MPPVAGVTCTDTSRRSRGCSAPRRFSSSRVARCWRCGRRAVGRACDRRRRRPAAARVDDERQDRASAGRHPDRVPRGDHAATRLLVLAGGENLAVPDPCDPWTDVRVGGQDDRTITLAATTYVDRTGGPDVACSGGSRASGQVSVPLAAAPGTRRAVGDGRVASVPPGSGRPARHRPAKLRVTSSAGRGGCRPAATAAGSPTVVCGQCAVGIRAWLPSLIRLGADETGLDEIAGAGR
jgi:hypothetical protein